MRRALILYGQGLSQAEIARRLGVHRSQISRDLDTLRHLLTNGKQGKVHRRRIVFVYRGAINGNPMDAGIDRLFDELARRGQKTKRGNADD